MKHYQLSIGDYVLTIGDYSMCGIVGVCGTKNAEQLLVNSLKLLEYRGYDSAGIALSTNDGISVLKTKGKVDELVKVVNNSNQTSDIGIAHTRWATHGVPSETNAHPHRAKSLVLVHNGIIENHAALRTHLQNQGYKFKSQTDTESLVWLIQSFLDEGLNSQHALEQAIKLVQGTYAILVMFDAEPNKIYGARYGSPLAVGRNETSHFMGSDALALSGNATEIMYLEDGDMVIIEKDNYALFDKKGKIVDRKWQEISTEAIADKGSFDSYMLKEIYEQPDVVQATFASVYDTEKEKIAFDKCGIDFKTIDKIHIVACGTSAHAGLVAKYWIERFTPVWVEVEVASEFRYRQPRLKEGGLSLFISQSGETADTLAALRYCKTQGQHILSIVNVPNSTIARESDIVLQTKAGPEIGVASTKAFTAQLTLLAALTLAFAEAHKSLPKEEISHYTKLLSECPALIRQILTYDSRVAKIAKKCVTKHNDVLFIGRGYTYPIALEGALKLKEISYQHAEGYSAGELKHGPIALVTKKVPTIVLAPNDDLFEKTISNMHEVKARGGSVILVSDAVCCEELEQDVSEFIPMPKTEGFIEPLLYVIPMQLLAYHSATALGRNVDQPRNLAKSVTVE